MILWLRQQGRIYGVPSSPMLVGWGWQSIGTGGAAPAATTGPSADQPLPNLYWTKL